MIAAWFLDQEIDKALSVDEQEISTYYDQNRSEYIRQIPSYDLQLILTATVNEANECREALTGGADFSVVARESSLDASKTKEGKIGWSTLNNFPEEVRRRIPTLRTGEISQPIQTAIGYYVIKVLGLRPKGEAQALDEVHDQIAWKIKAGKREEKYRQLIKQLRESNPVEIHWNMMDSLNIELK
jgi:parvulin-like peptidyl-prolyl isomerase